MNTEQQLNKWGQIVGKAWQDDAFKKRLMSNPSAVLKERGLEVPSGMRVQVVEDTDKVIHLTIPAKPRAGELSEEQLAGVAGGINFGEILKQSLFSAFGLTPEQERGGGRTPQQQAGSTPPPGSTPSQAAGGRPRPA